MTIGTQLLTIACISALAASATFRIIGPPERGVPCGPELLQEHEICLAQVMERWQGKVLWIDARPRAEWQADGMPGSILWNLDAREDANAFEQDAAAHLIEGGPVVVYCSEGSCGVSREVAEKVRKLELSQDVYALHGGVGALRAAGMLTGSRITP